MPDFPYRREGMQHFWSPPEPGENIVGMTQYEGFLVVATDRGVYVVCDEGRMLPDWVVRKIAEAR